MSFLGKLHGDAEVAELVSSARMLTHMREVEVAYLFALAAAGRVETEQAERVAAVMRTTILDDKSLRDATLRDGVVVPDLIRQLRQDLCAEDAAIVHTGMTSQDVVDTALMMALRDVIAVMSGRLKVVIAGLEHLTARFGAEPLMGRTRHQAALPITVGHRIAEWRAPLPGLMDQLTTMRSDLICLQLGGSVGLGDAFKEGVATHMAQSLGLHVPDACWHTNRHRVVGFGDWLSHVTGALGKIGRDVTLMAQQGIDAITLTGGGGSSAMAHKQNPILAETLVTFAQFNASQVGGLHHALVHEQERSGTAWALEWMILPLMIETTATALRHTEALLGNVTAMGDA
jgi:3-carboxy-cis,cis-muconate cycloisomerase